MLGTSYYNDGLVRQPIHLSVLWVSHNFLIECNQDDSPLHSIQITDFLAFITISAKSSFTGTLTVVTRDTYIYGSQDPCMMLVLPWLMVPPINLTGGRFTTGTGLFASILSIVNRNTIRWSALIFTISGCDAKDTSVGVLSTWLYLHDFVAFLYWDSILNSHIILTVRSHITN